MAAEGMGYAHEYVIHHHRQMICGQPPHGFGFKQGGIGNRICVPDNFLVQNKIMIRDFLIVRNPEFNCSVSQIFIPAGITENPAESLNFGISGFTLAIKSRPVNSFSAA
jgi:hypothetical protein